MYGETEYTSQGVKHGYPHWTHCGNRVGNSATPGLTPSGEKTGCWAWLKTLFRGPVGQNFHVDNSQFVINDYKNGFSRRVTKNGVEEYQHHPYQQANHAHTFKQSESQQGSDPPPPYQPTAPSYGETDVPSARQRGSARLSAGPQHIGPDGQPFRGRVMYDYGNGNTAVIDNGNYEYENGKLVSGP